MPRKDRYRVVVVGLGNFGSAAAEALQAADHDVLAVDSNPAAVDRVASVVRNAVVADGRSRTVLERIGAKGADAGIVSTGDDITASILATLALRDAGVQDVYVKVISTEHARVMEKLGVTETIFPEKESGERLALRVASHSIVNFAGLAANFGVQELEVPESWIGRTLAELDLRNRYRVAVIGLHEILTDTIIPVPDPKKPLTGSETLLLAGLKEDLLRVAEAT
jgi:trk system potassium uptake protein TrkA